MCLRFVALLILPIDGMLQVCLSTNMSVFLQLAGSQDVFEWCLAETQVTSGGLLSKVRQAWLVALHSVM